MLDASFDSLASPASVLIIKPEINLFVSGSRIGSEDILPLKHGV
jgi:hypothetical protein